MSDRIANLRKRLAAELRAMGAVRSADWQHAFERVPRHVLVPRFTRGYTEAGTPHAPYDRVIGTCYVWPLPQAWIAQTRPQGRVVALVPNGLVQLTVSEDDSASGPFHHETFGFMSIRGGHMPPRLPLDEVESLLGASGVTRRCRFPSRITEAGRNWSFWFFWGFFVAPFAHVRRPEREVLVMIDEVDRSWFRLDRRTDTVTQGGPRRMWDEIEGLFETWCRLGAPNREDLGLTVTPEGRHILWLDSPDSEHTWELPTAGLIARCGGVPLAPPTQRIST